MIGFERRCSFVVISLTKSALNSKRVVFQWVVVNWKNMSKSTNTQTATSWIMSVIFPWFETLAWMGSKICVVYNFSFNVFDFRVWVSLYNILEHNSFSWQCTFDFEKGRVYFRKTGPILEFRKSIWQIPRWHLPPNICSNSTTERGVKLLQTSKRCEIIQS